MIIYYYQEIKGQYKKLNERFYIPGEKIHFKEYKNGSEVGKEGLVNKRIGRQMYIIKDEKKKNGQKTLQSVEEMIDINEKEVEPVQVIYMFDVPMTIIDAEKKVWIKENKFFQELLESTQKEKVLKDLVKEKELF